MRNLTKTFRRIISERQRPKTSAKKRLHHHERRELRRSINAVLFGTETEEAI